MRQTRIGITVAQQRGELLFHAAPGVMRQMNLMQHPQR